MKVILTTLNAKYIHSSLALRYLKAYSQTDFPNIETLEYSIKEPVSNMVSDIYEKRPEVIGFSCYIWNIEQTIQLLKLVKKVLPSVKIVMGGPEVSYDIAYWFDRVKEIDYIVYGEGEHSFNQLLKAIKYGKALQEVKGIAYREQDRLVTTEPQIGLDLALLPSPYGDSDDIHTLRDKIVYFEASRGCPFSCAYCLSAAETGVRYFDINRVKKDLLKLIKREIKTIKFVDRTFNINKKFALEIFRFIIENNNNTVFQFEITADILNKEVLDYLNKNAPEGMIRFEIGIQSTNETTNSLINRRQDFARLTDVVLGIKEGGKIEQHLDLIAGLPGEDYDSFRKTFNDVFALGPDELQLGFLKILRGTPLWKDANIHGYVYMDEAPYEILYNQVLPYGDVIRLKRLEDILEKYWNSQRMEKTVSFMVDYVYDSSFDFFQDLGDYWAENRWDRIGHQLESLFEKLYQFVNDRQLKYGELIISLMKLDFFLNFKHKPRKTWWDFSLTKQEQNNYLKELIEDSSNVSDSFAELELNERNIHKHIMVEVLNYNIEGLLLNGDILEEKTLLIVYFDPPFNPRYFFKKLT